MQVTASQDAHKQVYYLIVILPWLYVTWRGKQYAKPLPLVQSSLPWELLVKSSSPYVINWECLAYLFSKHPMSFVIMKQFIRIQHFLNHIEEEEKMNMLSLSLWMCGIRYTNSVKGWIIIKFRRYTHQVTTWVYSKAPTFFDYVFRSMRYRQSQNSKLWPWGEWLALKRRTF